MLNERNLVLKDLDSFTRYDINITAAPSCDAEFNRNEELFCGYDSEIVIIKRHRASLKSKLMSSTL